MAQWGELTALSTGALLAAGRTPHDRRLAQAVAWLVQARLRTPSVVGLRGQALAGLFAGADRAAAGDAERDAVRRLQRVIEGDMRLLIGSVLDTPGHAPPAGLYPPDGEGLGAGVGAAAFDLEVSQTANTAMAAMDAADPGAGTFAYWQLTERPWRLTQRPDGSWLPDATPGPRRDVRRGARPARRSCPRTTFRLPRGSARRRLRWRR